MSLWTADYANDPLNDFEVALEIRYNDIEVAIIRKGNNKKDNLLEIEWYSHDNSLIIPLQWLSDLLVDAQKSLTTKKTPPQVKS